MKVLDEKQIKFVPECIEMKKPEYVYRFESEMSNMNCCYQRYKQAGASYQDAVDRGLSTVSYWKKEYPQICREWEEIEGNEFLTKFLFLDEVPSSKSEYDAVARYYNVIPFTPSVMLNISPNWGDECKGRRIQCLKQLVDSYMTEGWYDKWSYVIECGSEGTHIHAHIVAHMNVTRLKSVESHLRKGNHTRQLQKWSRKIEGMGGVIEGVSVQKIILRTEELVSDKLDYLIESKKPQGHKNHHVIKDGNVSGVL